MSKYDRVDLGLTPDGDLDFEKGDFKLVRNQEYLAQSIRNRAQTSDPDWYDPFVEAIGSNLEDLRGLPNTEETAMRGVELIGGCISRDGLVEPEDIYIQPTPYDRNTIAFFVFVNSPFDTDPIGFEIRYNLRNGMMVRGV